MSKAVSIIAGVSCEVPLRTINLFVLDNLCLLRDSHRLKSVLEIAERLIGLHAKRPQTPYLSLLARLPGFSPAQLDDALYRERTLLRAHCMRGTVHMLPLSQYRTVLSATAGQLNGMYERAFESLSDKQTVEQEVLQLIRERGPMARSEVAVGLPSKVDERDLYRILNELCTNGILVKATVKGSWRTSVYNYELLDRWQPSIPAGEDDRLAALTQLIEWYVAAYAPVTLKDISWWSGVSQAQVKAALARIERPIVQAHFEHLNGEALIFEDELSRLESWEPPRTPQVALLPSFDSYVIAYADRERYIDQAHYSKVFKRVSGIIEPVVLFDGVIKGTWKYSTVDGQLPIEMFDERMERKARAQMERVIAETVDFLKKADEGTGNNSQEMFGED
jgi:hypothetical protein